MRGIFLPVPSLQKLICVLVDAAIIVGSVLVALLVRFGLHTKSIVGYEGVFARTSVVALTLLLAIYYNDLYADHAPPTRRELVRRLGQSLVAGAVLLTIVYYAVPQLTVGRGVLLLSFPLCLCMLIVWRAVYYWVADQDSFIEKVIILGTGPEAKEIALELLERKHQGYRILGFLSTDPSEVGVRLVNPSVIGTFDDLPLLRHKLQANRIVVALEDRRGQLPLQELLKCKMEGVLVEEAPSFYEILAGQLPIRSLRPSWLIFSRGFAKSPLLQNSRRVAEFFIALVGFILSLPVLLLAALAIWLESGRPVLYRQERVGQEGKVFTLYKLRTMRQDAEAESGPVWAAANGDPRITRVGRFLRKSRIDELPQLFNVLKGDMGFVGPRPERPCFVEELQKEIPYYNERHSVKPGITGWAQVRLGYGSSIEENEIKLRYDLYYIKHMNPWLDILILLDTAKVILFGRGAR